MDLTKRCLTVEISRQPLKRKIMGSFLPPIYQALFCLCASTVQRLKHHFWYHMEAQVARALEDSAIIKTEMQDLFAALAS